MTGRGGYQRYRGIGQTPSVTSEIISPEDPRYVDIYPNVPGGGIVYPGTTPYYLEAPGGPGGSPTGTVAGAATTMGAGQSVTGTTSTGIFGMFGPFTGGSGQGTGFGIQNSPLFPNLNLNVPNWCAQILGTSTLGQQVCGGNLIYWLLGGVAVILLLSSGGRHR